MTKKNVKTNLLNHSEAKVRLLGEYLQRYLNIISNDRHTEKINIFDLFCGEGLYDNGGEGSPLVILKEVKKLHSDNVSKNSTIPSIDCYFNDEKEAKIIKLKQVITDKSLHSSIFGKIGFTISDYQDLLKRVQKFLPTLTKQKAFIFIDPYGYKHIKASQIKELMKNGKSEVLLWLPTQFMYRFSNNEPPKALYDFIEELTDYKDWKKSDSVWKFINQLRDGFQNYLGQDFFVDNFSIQKDPQTVFCLFFFTSHIKGFEKMLEAKWAIDREQGRGWEYGGNQPSLFFRNRTNPLEEKLRVFLKEKKRFNGDVYEFTLKQRYLVTHTNEIFKVWQKQGKLDVFNDKGEKARKGAFYNNYQNYYNSPKKVYYKLKN